MYKPPRKKTWDCTQENKRPICGRIKDQIWENKASKANGRKKKAHGHCNCKITEVLQHNNQAARWGDSDGPEE